jgi:hypothetical protein
MTYNLEGAPIWYTAQYLLQEFEGMYDEVLQRNRLGPYANMALAAKALAAVFPESEDVRIHLLCCEIDFYRRYPRFG